jgi:tetratricopeptide (TPR) repeat protein
MNKLKIFKTSIPFIVTAVAFFSLISRTFCQEEVDPNSDTASVGKAEQPKTSPSLKNSLDEEIVAREKQAVAAEQKVQEARKAFELDKYKEAVDLYMDAYEKFKPLAATSKYIQRKMKKINSNLAMVYYYWARSLYTQAQEDSEMKRYDEAVEKCKNILKMDPTMTSKVERLMKRISAGREGLLYKNETDESVVDKNKKDRLYQIDVLMAQGRKLYAQKLWHRAREKFEDVLLIDPYNLTAIELIRKLTRKMYSAGVKRFDATIRERNAETLWKHVTPLIPRSLTPVIDTAAPVKKNDASSIVKKKLDSIIIEHMEFDEATISAVVDMLRLEAKKQDKEHKGVNILLRLQPAPSLGGEGAGGGAAESSGGEDAADGGDKGGVDFLLDDASDDKADAGGDAGTDAGADDDTEDDGGGVADSGAEPTITIMFDDLSLGEAIRNICLAADLKYRVEDYAVVIAANNVALDDLETRIYPIDSEVDMGNGDGGDGGDGEDGGGGATTSVKEYFQKRGISFPEGSKIVFDSGISRLIATNTPEQLKRIERIIDELNVVDPQVLIECKFVEIQENKAKELGFEFSMAKPASNNGSSSWSFDQNDAPLRYLNGTNWNGGNDVAFSVQRTDSDGITYRGIIHALDQMDNVDILSTPRITTQNGEEATIRMVTDTYYPESWSEGIYVTNSWGRLAYSSPMPQFPDPTEIGVKMTVTPTVDPDKYTISLSLQPVVQQFSGWLNYSYVIIDPTGRRHNNIILMPIIEARTVDTEITVYDGETIVMGGIMRDTIDSVNDTVPILGKLPLVGRLFQSKYSTSQKSNLLIFVTPRLVTPNGAPLRQREVRGMPPFRM